MPFTADEAFQLLKSAHEQDRLAHAYLLAGPIGSGKRALANRACSLLLGVDVEDFQHPDVHLVEPESKSRQIVIAQTRELERNLQMRSLLGGCKLGIIVDADRLNQNAANSFLKTLEEPPSKTHLLLLSSQPEQMLETILSRCLELPLHPTAVRATTPLQARLLATLEQRTREDTSGVVRAFGIVREFQVLLGEARGAIQAEADAALKAEEQHYKQASDASRWLEDREDYYKALVESRYIATRNTLLETLEQWWADALRQQSSAPALDQPEYSAATAALASRYSTAALLRKSAALETLRQHLSSPGVQEQLAIECAFLTAFAA